MKKIFLFFLTALIAVFTLNGAEFVRIHNLYIVLPEKPSAIEKAAAAELETHLRGTFSKPVELNGKTPDKIKMFIGISPEARNAGFTGNYAEALAESKFGIYRNNNDFLFCGFDTVNGNAYIFKDSCGTLLAVEYFAQKYLNAKFFLPGKAGVKYAADPQVSFAAVKDVPQPSYAVRGFQSAAGNVAPRDFMLFFRRRLGQVPPWATRNYYYCFINKWNKRFKHKPEMFAMHGGKRFLRSYPYHFPCPSHPDVVKQVVSDVSAALKKNPKIYGVRFFCDAPVKNCECTRCVNSPAGKLVTAGDKSEFVFAFFCKFANELKKIKPDLQFHLQTKSSHFQPPRTEKLPSDTVIAILSGHFNAPDYDALRNRCDQWKNAGAKVVLYSYPRAPEMKTYPVMNPHRIADHFKEMKGFAQGATMAEGRKKVPYSFSALNTYVQSAIMFDCSLDTDKLIAEFCSLAAPEAAAELQAFYTTMEDLLKDASFRDDPIMNCYLPFRLKKPRELLNKVLKKAPQNRFLQALDRDFGAFEKIAFNTAGAISNEEVYSKLLKEFQYRQNPIKLSAGESVLKLRPFAFYRDFQKTSIALSCQADQMVIKIKCSERSMEKLIARCKENHVGPIWSDDAVEIFFSPAGKFAPYMHLTVNSNGVYRVIKRSVDGRSSDYKNLKLKTSAVREKDHWALQIIIPLSELKTFVGNDQLSMGICRHRPPRNKDKIQGSGVQKSVSGSFNDISGRFIVEF